MAFPKYGSKQLTKIIDVCASSELQCLFGNCCNLLCMSDRRNKRVKRRSGCFSTSIFLSIDWFCDFFKFYLLLIFACCCCCWVCIVCLFSFLFSVGFFSPCTLLCCLEMEHCRHHCLVPSARDPAHGEDICPTAKRCWEPIAQEVVGWF